MAQRRVPTISQAGLTISKLFGRMMRESGSFDEVVVGAIRRIRGRYPALRSSGQGK